MEKIRKCEYCGKEFIAKNKLHKYCSVSCRDRYLWEYDVIQDLDKCKLLINEFLNNNVKSAHSSEYDLDNFKLIKNNTIQYIQKKTN